MHLGGAMMMLGRGRSGEGGAENNCSGKYNFRLVEHFCISRWSFAVPPNANKDETVKTPQLFPSSS
jgi:hypothetical protein